MFTVTDNGQRTGRVISCLIFLLIYHDGVGVALGQIPSGSRGQPAQLLFRPPGPHDPEVPPTTLPPTELRLTFTPDARMTHGFPSRIRFSAAVNSRITEDETVTTSKPPLDIVVHNAEPRTDPDSFAEIDQFAATNNGAANNRLTPWPLSQKPNYTNLPTETLILTPMIKTAQNETVFVVQVVNRSSDANEVDFFNRSSWTRMETRSLGLGDRSSPLQQERAPMRIDSENDGSYAVGRVTVGALVGIIAGILMAMVLGTLIGLVCYRRRHPTWDTAESDLRVLASHYGSYWDDKTLPNYQFNDRMIWPGETHEEMIALDNDAFLKSLENLGRVSSRPPSKTNWNAEEDQRQSTKV